MEIRVAVAQDSADLVRFNQAMALETEGKTLAAEVLAPGVEAVFADPKKGFYVVADNKGSIVGGLLITYEWSDWRNKWFWWIQSVYIVPDERGRGLYSRLYQFVKEFAERRGDVCGFRLYVEKENTRAQAVYEKVGMNNSHYLMFEEEK